MIDRIGNFICTVVLLIAGIYFGTIVAHAWLAGRFAGVSR